MSGLKREKRFLRAMYRFDETTNDPAAHAAARAEMLAARDALQPGDVGQRHGMLSARAMAELSAMSDEEFDRTCPD